MEKEQGGRGSSTRFGFYKDIWFIYAVNEALHLWQMDMDGGCVGFVNLMKSFDVSKQKYQQNQQIL